MQANDKDLLLALSKKEKNVKQKNRFDVVLLFLEGYSRKEISCALHIPLRTLSNYIFTYQTRGLSALTIKKQLGQPKKLRPEQEADLFKYISTSTPKQEGLGPFQNWTAALACLFVKKTYGVIFQERGMRDLFYRIGLSYTRPTYTLKNADKEKQEAFRETMEGLKKKS